MRHGQTLHVTLDLLDRQLHDRDGLLCGNVDDLELDHDESSNELVVIAILAGSGALAQRLGWHDFGRWLHRADERLHDARRGHGRIATSAITRIGPAIDVDVEAADLSTHDMERWALDHIIRHIPWARSGDASE